MAARAARAGLAAERQGAERLVVIGETDKELLKFFVECHPSVADEATIHLPD